MQRIEHKIIDGVECKRCGKCKTYKPVAMFNKNEKVWDGLGHVCKDCNTKMATTIKWKEHCFQNGIEQKWCGCCQRWLTLDCFAKNRAKSDGLQERCKECRSKHYKKVGPPDIPKEVRKERHRNTLIRSYGLSVEEFNEMISAQGNRCAICGKKEPYKRVLSIDHDHQTGKVRGLLCTRCNTVLGMLNDNIELLNKMEEYLKSHTNE